MMSAEADKTEQNEQAVDSSVQLLNKLQQTIDDTIEQLTETQRVQFGNALKHVQRNHDFFQERINDPDMEGCLEQMVSIFTTQLDEILAAAQIQRSIDDACSDFVLELTTNAFPPRAKIGQRLGMRRGCRAEDGDLVAIKLGDKWRVEWYSQDKEYEAVCVAIMAKRPTQQAELQA